MGSVFARRLGRIWIYLGGLALASGCGSHTGGILDEEEVIALCDRLIAEIEAGSSTAQRAAFEDVAAYVAGYAFTPSPAPPRPREIVPYTLEPTDPPHLYRMVGALALFNGSRSAGLWASLKALRSAPGEPVALAQAGVLLTDAQRCEEAEGLLRTAKHHDRDGDALLRLSLSVAYACRDEPSRALAEVREAVELAPENLIVKSALADLLFEEMPALSARREALFSACADDILQALSITDMAQWNAVLQARLAATQTLQMESLQHLMAMPAGVPYGLSVACAEAQERYLAKARSTVDDPLDQALSAIMQGWTDQTNSLAQILGDCCAAAPDPCCGCLYAHCFGTLDVVEQFMVPGSTAALARFLPGATRLFKDYELELAGEILRYWGEMPAGAADWTVSHNANLLTLLCQNISLQVLQGLQPALLAAEQADAGCQMAASCVTAQQEALKEAQRQRIEAERQAALDAAWKKAGVAPKAPDLNLRGELCLDSVGCVGIDGDKLSAKIGGGLFAQFSVDVARVSLGVRVGVGISDPTGGNLCGADLSVGGEVSAGGTSFDIVQSTSAEAGTLKQDISLFKSSFRF
jgi:hypothetical protein